MFKVINLFLIFFTSFLEITKYYRNVPNALPQSDEYFMTISFVGNVISTFKSDLCLRLSISTHR